MRNAKIELVFLKSSVERFLQDVGKIEEFLQNHDCSSDDKLEILAYLVAVKESVEALEIKYSKYF